MDEIGYMYIPTKCVKGEFCTLHVHLHGCWQGAGVYKDAYLRSTGLLEFAASNNIILLFPQSVGTLEYRDYGELKYCWQSQNTDDKFNPQIWSIQKMMSALILQDELGEDDYLTNMVNTME